MGPGPLHLIDKILTHILSGSTLFYHQFQGHSLRYNGSYVLSLNRIQVVFRPLNIIAIRLPYP